MREIQTIATCRQPAPPGQTS